MRRAALWLFLALLGSACGDDGPSQPSTPPTPTVSSLSISGVDAVRTGFFTTYTATASMSNGTTQTVTPTWTTTSADIASIDAAGRLDGRGHGTVTITASNSGRTASKNVNVVQNFGGTWNGMYRLAACDEAGAFRTARWCQSLGGVGAILPFTLTAAQAGNGLNEMSGTLGLGDLRGNVSGNVTGDARLVMGGTFTVTASGITFSITIGGWDTRAAAGDSMTGGWAQNLTAIGVAGNAYMESQIVSANHTAQQSVASVAPDRYVLTWLELFRRLTSR